MTNNHPKPTAYRVVASDPDSRPWWRVQAGVTRRATGWGYWIKGQRVEEPGWTKDEAYTAAQADLDNWIDE